MTRTFITKITGLTTREVTIIVNALARFYPWAGEVIHESDETGTTFNLRHEDGEVPSSVIAMAGFIKGYAFAKSNA